MRASSGNNNFWWVSFKICSLVISLYPHLRISIYELARCALDVVWKFELDFFDLDARATLFVIDRCNTSLVCSIRCLVKNLVNFLSVISIFCVVIIKNSNKTADLKYCLCKTLPQYPEVELLGRLNSDYSFLHNAPTFNLHRSSCNNGKCIC